MLICVHLAVQAVWFDTYKYKTIPVQKEIKPGVVFDYKPAHRMHPLFIKLQGWDLSRNRFLLSFVPLCWRKIDSEQPCVSGKWKRTHWLLTVVCNSYQTPCICFLFDKTKSKTLLIAVKEDSDTETPCFT